jgi:hypothetical protein
MMSEYWFDISVKLSRILILDCKFFARYSKIINSENWFKLWVYSNILNPH